ncbi:unnamed protein product [Schistocephalus solidus]|uniref:Eyes absent homolog n=1 Tax=Schistocephalus solidus TaxID=70667 RepID=A0A183TLU5_SCHSO|nr:unnamed protein product [Schistocephalus solidus]
MAGFCSPLNQPSTQTIKSEDSDHGPSIALDTPDRAVTCPYCPQGTEHEARTTCCQPHIENQLSVTGGDAGLKRIFIWSLEDILILESSLSGKFIQLSSKEIAEARLCLRKVDEHVVSAANQHFFYQETEEFDQAHIDDVAGSDSEQELRYVLP